MSYGWVGEVHEATLLLTCEGHLLQPIQCRLNARLPVLAEADLVEDLHPCLVELGALLGTEADLSPAWALHSSDPRQRFHWGLLLVVASAAKAITANAPAQLALAVTTVEAGTGHLT